MTARTNEANVIAKENSILQYITQIRNVNINVNITQYSCYWICHIG